MKVQKKGRLLAFCGIFVDSCIFLFPTRSTRIHCFEQYVSSVLLIIIAGSNSSKFKVRNSLQMEKQVRPIVSQAPINLGYRKKSSDSTFFRASLQYLKACYEGLSRCYKGVTKCLGKNIGKICGLETRELMTNSQKLFHQVFVNI